MKPAQINLKIVVLSLMAFMLGAGPLVPLTTARDGRANPAGSFIVSNLNDSGTGSLRQAIADATPGSTINFAPGLSGTITLTGGELLIDKDLTIIGPGASVLTVSGNNITRVFNIQGRNVSISGLTIANGNAGNDSGGGILNDSGRLLMFGSYIVNNKALNGAGIAIVNSGSADIFATGIMLNNASGDGGGIKLGNSNPNLVRIDSSTISNNTAGGDGGGIYSHAGAGPLLAGNTTISSNMATNGAGVYSQSNATALFFSGVTNNTATNNGGGVLLPAVSVANLNSTYIAVNNAPSSGPDVSGDFLADFSLIGNGSGGNITGSNNHVGTPADPINPMITPLQDNGGRTWTHSPIEGSPMIGAADPNIGLPIDQRNGDRDSTPDIGPVEFKIRNPASLEIISIKPSADPNFIDTTIRLTEASTGLPISFRDISFAFIRTFGDIDGDGALKPTDPAGFATGTLKIFGTPVPSGIYADFDGDGNYHSSDLSVFFSRATGPPNGPQGGGCQFLIFGTSESYAANGGAGSFNITTFPQDCNWTASSNDPWIQITSAAAGTGDGVVSYSVDPHTDAFNPRSGTITAAGLTFTVHQGAAFPDVPETDPFYTSIGKLSARRVTLGVGGGNYGPDILVSREQMAAFIIRALGEFNPPEPAQQRFADVPPTNVFYRFIEQMAVRQITLGCGGGNYCPSEPVSREQMATFLIRASGELSPPVPVAQRFGDVGPSNIFYNFIERLAARRITLGCSATQYCPTDNVTRAQMAAFLVRAFNL